MAWGQQRKTKFSNKLSLPNPNEGSDGDIQVRQTNLGAKLFAKIGGSWKSTFLSDEEEIIGTSGTKIGMSSSGTLTVSEIQCAGRIKVGKADGSFNETDNINIGQVQSGIGTYNVCIGYKAGEDITANTVANVIIGYHAGKEINGTNLGHVCIGGQAGDSITTGTYTTLIGYQTDGAASATNQIAIGNGAVTDGANKGRWGNSSIATNNIQADWTVDSDSRIKKDIENSDIGLLFVNALKTRKYKKKHPSEYDAEILEARYKQGGSNYDDDKDEIIKDEFDDDKVWNGLIAQEVKVVMDDLDVEFSGWSEDTKGKQGIQYSTLVVPLIKAVQELSAKVDTMQTEINNLKAE